MVAVLRAELKGCCHNQVAASTWGPSLLAVLRAELKRLLLPIRLLRPLGGPARLQCCPNRGPAIHTTVVSKLQGCVHRGHSLLAVEVELRVCCTRQGPALLRCRNEAIVVLCPLGVSLLTMLRADMRGHQAQWGPSLTYHGGRTTGAVFTWHTAANSQSHTSPLPPPPTHQTTFRCPDG